MTSKLSAVLWSFSKLILIVNFALLGALAHRYGFIGPVLGIYTLLTYRHILDEIQPEVTLRYGEPNELDSSKPLLDKIRIPEADLPLFAALIIFAGVGLFFGMVSALLFSLVINIGQYAIPLFIIALLLPTLNHFFEIKYMENATFEDILRVEKHKSRSTLHLPAKYKTHNLILAPNNGSYTDWKDIEEATMNEDESYITIQTYEFTDNKESSRGSGLYADTPYGDTNAIYQLPLENLIIYDTHGHELATIDSDTLR